MEKSLQQFLVRLQQACLDEVSAMSAQSTGSSLQHPAAAPTRIHGHCRIQWSIVTQGCSPVAFVMSCRNRLPFHGRQSLLLRGKELSSARISSSTCLPRRLKNLRSTVMPLLEIIYTT